MSFDMMPLLAANALVDAAEVALRRAGDNIGRNRVIFTEERSKLFELVKPIFEEELKGFLVTMPYRFIKDAYCFAFDAKKRAIFVDATLENVRGNQPYAFFTEDGVRELSERFARAINPRLAEEGILVVFGGFIFPPEYMLN